MDNVSLNVSVQGEKPFKASLQEINAALRVNNAELEAVKAAYEGNGQSIDALTAKQDVLDRSLLTQKERVEALEDALRKTGQKYGETDSRTLKFQESLIKAQTQLDKTKRELDDTSLALEKAGQETNKMSVSLLDVADAAGLSLPPALSSLTEKLDGVSASGAAFVGILGGIITGLTKATLSTAETAKELQVMSQTTGLTVEQLQELEYASAALGMEEDEVQDKMKDLVSAMRDARDGSEDMQGAFKRLGVSIEDNRGQLKDSSVVFFDVIDALGKVQNATERDALAMQIFGEEAQKLNPMIEAGIDTLNGLSEEANNLGYVMDTGTIDKFSQLDDTMAKMAKQADALKNSFAVVLLPILTSFFEVISKIPTPVLQMLIIIGAIVPAVINLGKSIKDVTSMGKDLTKFFTDSKGGLDKVKLAIVAVVLALIALVAIIAVIIGKKGEVEDTFSTINKSVGQMSNSINGVKNGYSNIQYHARGTDFHSGGLAIVGEEGPELVDLPRGSKVYSNSRTQQMLSGQTNTYYVTINAKDVKEFNDIVRIAQQKKSSIRQGYVGG